MLEAILVLVMGLLIAAGVIDFKARKIPNWLSGSIFILFCLFIVIQQFFIPGPPVIPVVSSLITGLAVSIVFIGLFYFGFLGGGDVKLISALGFWAGLDLIASFIVIMAITGGIVAFFYMFRKHTEPELIEKNGNTETKKPGKQNKKQVKKGKIENKSGNIPYGIAISVGGLFTVNQILTNLIA